MCGYREGWKVMGSPLRTKRNSSQGVLWRVFLVIPPEMKVRAAHKGLSTAQQAGSLTVWGRDYHTEEPGFLCKVSFLI